MAKMHTLTAEVVGHGRFSAPAWKVEIRMRLSKDELAEDISHAYHSNRNEKYAIKAYWMKMPKPILAVIHADCYQGDE
jgi:hypothetical protein